MSPAFAAVGLHVALALLLNVALQVIVIRQRMASRVSLGTGSDPALERKVRAHGNFAENMPFLLLGLGALALNGFPPLVIHGLGLVALSARLSHAYALASSGQPGPARTFGVATTFLLYVTMSAMLIARFLGLA